jgi:hypothetical protein
MLKQKFYKSLIKQKTKDIEENLNKKLINKISPQLKLLMMKKFMIG